MGHQPLPAGTRLTTAPRTNGSRHPRMRRCRLAAYAALLASLTGCGAPRIAQFAAGQPSMAPNLWMNGTVDGYGVIIDRFGTVKSQFHAHESGVWDAAARTMTLTEHITYLQSDSTRPSDRIWHFVERSPGVWTGSAADVIGTPTGAQEGNAWHLVFQQDLPIGGHQIKVTVDDWRFRESDTVAIDHSVISKFGILLATSEIAFVKSP